jgi:hypothetical protein
VDRRAGGDGTPAMSGQPYIAMVVFRPTRLY